MRPCFVAMLWVMLASVGAEAAAEGDCAQKVTARIQARYENVNDLSARFEQRTRPVRMGGGTGAETVSKGRVWIAKPGKMRWSYEDPEQSLVVSDGKTLWLYDPAFGEAQKLPATGGFLTGAAAEFLLGAGDLAREFEIRALSCEGALTELELIPREAAGYEKLVLEADPTSGDVRRSVVVDLLGNVTQVEFIDVQLGAQPDESRFRFEPPKGVRVIEIGP